MLLREEREKIIEYGIKMINSGLAKDTSGNLSIYNREKQLMAISPSGVDYLKIEPSNIMIINMIGEIIDGDKTPSSELHLHKIFYENRKDISAMVHTHSTYATTLSCLNWNLPATHYMIAVAGPDIRCAKYATFGTPELAQNAYEAMLDRKAVLLANHGLLTGADTLEKAFNIAEEIEYCAELYHRAKSIGEPIIIDKNEMERIIKRFKTYGVNEDL